MPRPSTPSRVLPVVVACEDTLGASSVLEAARALASRLGAPLLPVWVSARGEGAYLRESARNGQAAVAHDTQTLLDGIPAIEIVRYAEAKRAGLLVLGIGKEGEGPTGNLKELADAVVRRSEIPCLILPAGQDRLGRMHVALDGSERGMRALRVAWTLRAIQEGEVSAILVSAQREQREGVVGPPVALAQQIGARVTETLGPGSGVAVVHRCGDVVAEVLQGLSAEAGDLLVIGVRRGGPADPSDSTGEGRRLLAAASCAILTVPL